MFTNISRRISPRIVEYLPAPHIDDTKVWIVVSVYSLLFVVGVCGHTSLLTRTGLFYRKSRLHTVLLSLTRLAHLLALPLLILDQIVGYWLLGPHICKLYKLLDSVTKTTTSSILIAIAFELYSKVFLPNRARSKLLLAAVVVPGIFLLVPMVYAAEREKVIIHETKRVFQINRMVVYKCSDHLKHTHAVMFVLGFLTPLALNIFYLSKLLKHGRMALIRVFVACFYFCCWMPCWATQLFSIYVGTPPEIVELILYALPYVNSAFSWILLDRINKEARNEDAVNRSTTSVTIAVEQEGRSVRRRRFYTEKSPERLTEAQFPSSPNLTSQL